MQYKVLATNITACLILALISAISISLITFQYYEVDLGDAWTFSGSVFGGLATLAAAYIASHFYEDWKESAYHQYKIENINKTLDALEEISRHLMNIKLQIILYERKLKPNKHWDEEDRKNMHDYMWTSYSTFEIFKTNILNCFNRLSVIQMKYCDTSPFFDEVNSHAEKILKHLSKYVEITTKTDYIQMSTDEFRTDIENFDKYVMAHVIREIVKDLAP